MDRIKVNFITSPEHIFKNSKHLQLLPINATSFTPLAPEEGRHMRQLQAAEMFDTWLTQCEKQLDRKVRLDEPLQDPDVPGEDKRAAVELWGRKFFKYG
jgi:hypothetical protein